ncbi:MAG: TlpA family protein disulfide reductase, partial [Candidatus Cloacimonetes bacterium]|nr:TlpA family protein disulfide reductase [Candidatus Cloacimonadota bacterium]
MKKTLLIIFTLSLTLLLADRIQDFTVQDIDGNQVNFYEKLMNGPVILDFWATWCKPCLKELPHLNAIASKYEQVTVIAISVDKPRKAADVRTTIKSNQFKFITVHDTSQQLQKLLNVTSVPRTIIVDREGEIK